VEVDYEERQSQLYFIKYPLANDSGSLTVATTRPETYFADVAIAVNPSDERYEFLQGKEVILPQINRRIPVIADEGVDLGFGTGVLKVTPAHDLTDYEIGKRHGLPLIAGVDKEGRLTEVAGEFAGLKTGEAREKVVEKLKVGGFLEKIESYAGSVAACERCKSEVEPLISEEWFVKMATMSKKAVEAINQGEINFYPADMAKVLTSWLENIHDWCISRSLWWGHQIPVWYCNGCNKNHNPYSERGVVVYVPQDFNDAPKECPDCKGSRLAREEQVLDTWFSSGIWPLTTLGWPQKTPELIAYFPFSFEISGGEIKFLWIARMIMLAEKHIGEVPWQNMFFNGMLRDLQGRKFSKSLGNGVDPIELLQQFGTDVLRAVLTTYAVAGRDGRINKQLIIERCQNYRNFANKLWNASRFVFESQTTEDRRQIAEDGKQKTEDDLKMQTEVKRVVEVVTKHLEDFNFHLALEEIYGSFWHQFCDWYIEAVKPRLRGGDEASKAAAQQVLRESLLTYLKLLHPIMPFITERLWRLFDEEPKVLMLAGWPAK
jgi:valyl-tRNA synthetase